MARVLVVDDSRLQLGIFQKFLKRNGHEVIATDGGAKAIALAKSKLPDLIIMDIVMPDIDGFQAARDIKQNEETANIPIVLISSRGAETDIVWGRRQGAVDYLVKPFTEQVLVAMVTKVLNLSSDEDSEQKAV